MAFVHAGRQLYKHGQFQPEYHESNSASSTISRGISGAQPQGQLQTADKNLTLTIPDAYVASGTSHICLRRAGKSHRHARDAKPHRNQRHQLLRGQHKRTPTVTYSLSGNNLTHRQQIAPAMASSGNGSLVVATGVSSFQLGFTEQATLINFTVCFQSQLNASRASATSATSTTISASAALRDKIDY